MKKTSFLILSLLLLIENLSYAATQITLSGSPAALTINAAVAGSDPTSVTNASTTYGVQTATSGRTVTGAINTAMPANVTLKVQLTAPSGATSAGLVTMTTTAATLVSNINTPVLTSGLSVTYNLAATAAAAQVASATKTITYTIQ